MINQLLKNEIIEYCLNNLQEESCGFIVKTKDGKIIFSPCVNMHPDKINNFLISPKDYLQAKSNGQILFLFHSHFNSDSFSEADIFYSKYHNLNMIIYNVKSGNFNIFEV